MNGIYLAIIAVGLIVGLPYALEWRRKPVERLRDNAPGQFATLPQGVTHFQWSGAPDAPIVVCVHGLTTPSIVWGAVVPELVRMGYRVLTYDLYGRGYSDRVSGDQTGDFFARQLFDLLKDQRVEGQVDLLGYSMGGAIGAYVAAHHPDRVRRTVLVAPAGLGHDLGRFSDFAARSGWVGHWLQVMMFGWLFRRGVRTEAGRVTSAVKGIHDKMMAETFSRGFAAAVLSSRRHILANTLSDEHQKVADNGAAIAVIWAAEDETIPQTKGAEYLSRYNPEAQQVVMDDCGHEVTYAKPHDLMVHLRRILGQTVPSD